MSGTLQGGKRAAATNKAKYGNDFYKKIGAMGGSMSGTGGFASDLIGEDGLTGRERAQRVGRWGGQRSRRAHRLVSTDTKGKPGLPRCEDRAIKSSFAGRSV